MDLEIRGRVAVVLAASRGIGRGCAEALAAEGVRLAICARDVRALRAAAGELEAKTEVFWQACDVTNRTDSAAFLEAVRRRFGPIEILVNNCGGPPPGGFEETADESLWRQAFERSLYQVVHWTRQVVPDMTARGWGRIVNIVSTSVRQVIDGLLLSNSIRPGVLGFTRAVSRELAAKGILINCVLPGSILSDRTRELAEARCRARGIPVEEEIRSLAKEVPLGRLGTPREIGDAVAFLCSERASYITGSALVVDGGLLRCFP